MSENDALLVIDPLESLLLRGPGEFDPSSRGVYAYASSMIAPRPSSIAGLLSTLLMNLMSINVEKSRGEWYRAVLGVLERAGITSIKGPLILDENMNVYAPLLVEGETILFNINNANYVARRIEELEKLSKSGKDKGDVEKARKIVHELKKCHELLVRISERTGVGLKTRSKLVKAVEEGLIYTAKYTSSYALRKRERRPPEPVKIRYAAILSFSNSEAKEIFAELIREREVPVRLGGEHRIAKLTLMDLGEAKSLTSRKASSDYAVLLSPILLRSAHQGVDNALVLGLLDCIGAGFDVRLQRRKPIYVGLIEGSVVRLGSSEHSNELLINCYEAFGLTSDEEYYSLARIGFGTMLRL